MPRRAFHRAERRPLVVFLRPAESPRKSIEVLRWLRWLLPAALLVVSGSPLPSGSGHEVIAIDADSVESGPLSVADAVDRVLRQRRELSRHQ